MTTNGEVVSAWLSGNDDTASVFSEFPGNGASEFGDFDEERFRIDDVALDTVSASSRGAGDKVARVLEDVAEAMHRRAVGVMYREYTRGRMLVDPDFKKRDLQVQRFFRLEKYYPLSGLDDPSLFSDLASGVVRARLSAQTAVGKTFKLPGMIASKCGLRVCQLEPDTWLAGDALAFQKKEYKIAGHSTAWSRQKCAYLTTMSYHDFRGVILSASREQLFNDFDVFYMDEAHEPTGVVWAAMQYFAAFSKPHNSLLVVSATMSTQTDNNAVASTVGRFDVAPVAVSVDEAMDSGDLLGRHLKDRTQVIVATDEDVAKLRAYYEENGIDVMYLDSASTREDGRRVTAALSVSAMDVPRVLVTNNFGTGHSFPVSYVVSTCERRVYDLTPEHTLLERRVPLMNSARVQHQGRVGRGLATGAGGWLMRPDVAPERELLLSEALEAYLSLVAAKIKPLASRFGGIANFLPKGIDASVARMLLRGSLPPALTVRYLGSDGRFASKFVEGMKLFYQAGERLPVSKDEYPVGYSSWVSEQVGRYYEGDDSSCDVELHVPFACPDGLKVQMHAITAISEGYLDIPYWNCYDEEEVSDKEEVGVRTKVRRKVKPRRADSPERVAVESVSTSVEPWRYDADPGDARVRRERRKAMSWTAQSDGKTAMTTLLRAIEAKELGRSVASPLEVEGEKGKYAYALPLEDVDAMVSVRSAGGGKILMVSQAVHEGFMSGTKLKSGEVLAVLQYLIENRALERFAKSTVFDNWSPAWVCWFTSFSDSGIFREIKGKGFHSDAVKLLSYLYDRFSQEVVTVAASSHLYRDKLGSFFTKRPSVTKFAKAVRKGSLPVAQSDAFVENVLKIKDSYDVAVLSIEESGVYAPKQVTRAQKHLPIRDRIRNMDVIDEEVVARDKMARLKLDDKIVDWAI